MKKLTFAFLLMAGLAMFINKNSSAQTSVTTDASIAIAEALVIYEQRDLDYGMWYPTGGMLAISLIPDNGSYYSTGGTLVGSAPLRAEYLVYGTPNVYYTISTWSNSSFTLTNTNNSAESFALYASAYSSNGAGAGYFFDASGSDLLYVGGDLNYSNSGTPSPGTYTGQFGFTIAYQ